MMIRRVPLLGLLCAVLALGGLPAMAQTSERCFSQTGFCISGRIREFWEQNGGLAVFGYPIGPQGPMVVEGQTFQAQLFERNRMELHPEKQRPYDVLLGRLGADVLAQQGRDPFTFPTSTPQAGCRYFSETKHNVCGAILSAWHANGLEIDGRSGKTETENLGLFGLPLSDLQTETIEGKPYQVQWFERARFELHPENQPPFNVLLGLLGREFTAPPTTTPTPTAAPTTPTPTPAGGLPAPSFNNCQADPNAANAPNKPIRIVTIDKQMEIVILQNVSDETVDLDGWRMCSINGNQLHEGITGPIEAGETLAFQYAGSGSIWSNNEEDDGALYNPAGQLVSYFNA